MSKEMLYIGTYTCPILFGTGEILQGKGKGIHIYEMDTETGELIPAAVEEGIDNPSFLAISPGKDYLYAVNELKEFEGSEGGSVSAFAIEKNYRLRFLDIMSTGGQDPCHVSVDGTARFVVVSNFMTGSVAVFETAEDGSLCRRSEFIQHKGKSLNKARQAVPHAHSAVFSPDGRYLYVPDLGMDKVVAYRLTDDGRLRELPDASYSCEPGFGPRFCEFHPELPVCYLIGELSSEVAVLAWDSNTGGFREIQKVPTLPGNFSGSNICADLHVSKNGRFLLASNRGHDSLACYAVSADTGKLEYLRHVPSGGRTPRNFSFSPDNRFVLVGNQDSDIVSVFAFDAEKGELKHISDYNVPTPVCVKFLNA